MIVVEKLSDRAGIVASVAPDTGLIYFSLPRYTVGLDVRDGVVVEAPPIARWALGRTVEHIWRDGLARGVELRWINPPFGHTVRKGQGLIEVQPARCTNGHRLEPRKVKCGFALCGCDKVRLGSTGHATYACLHPGCGDVLYGDGHAADRRLVTSRPAPSLLDLQADERQQRQVDADDPTGR